MTTSTRKTTKTAKKAPAKKAAAKVDNAGVHEYRDQLPLTALVKHPKNPRHRAVADAELVDSVKASGIVQPLIAAPHLGETGIEVPDQYVLIAGHRRLDAAKKARRKTVPVVIRRDLVDEGSQIEAMLVENGRRLDLTPIEEAEGYAQLELLGIKAPAIAKAVGRDVKTVRTRMKLLKLSSSTRTKVHKGQLTLDDAAALVEFADDPAVTKKLEQAASSPNSWTFPDAVKRARRERDQAREVATRRAKLLDAGATEIPLKKGQTVYSITGVDVSRLSNTHSTDWGQHKGCLAFVEYSDQYSGPQLHELCTDPTSHRAALDEETRRREEEWEAEQEARKKATLEEAAAADRRVETLMKLVEGEAVPAPIGDVLRVLLVPQLRAIDDERVLGHYQVAMGIPVDDRWAKVAWLDARVADRTKFAQHVDDLVAGGNATIAKALVALTVAKADRDARNSYYARPDEALRYLALLEEAGHPFSPVDTELRETHQAKLDEKTAAKKAS